MNDDLEITSLVPDGYHLHILRFIGFTTRRVSINVEYFIEKSGILISLNISENNILITETKLNVNILDYEK